MQAVRTEELLTRVRRAASGGEPPEEITPLIEAVALATQQTLAQFLAESADDPEMPAATRDEIAQALEGYLVCLARLSEAAASEDLRNLAEAADEAEKSVESVRAAQLAHRRALSEGPTVFPYLNRLLIQYDAVREGADGGRLLALLGEAPNFLQWLRAGVAARTVSPVDAQNVFYLQQLVEALRDSLQEQWALPEIEDDLVELASRLAGLLGEPLREEVEEGPTPIPAVNQVLEALESCSGVPEEVDFLLCLMSQCRNCLRTILPASSPVEVVANLNSVLASLDSLERCLREQIGFDELVAAATELDSSANALAEATTLASAQTEPGDFSMRTRGLPVMFKSVLRPAYAFVAGRGDVDTVLAASDHLERTASQMYRETTRVAQSDSRLEAVQEAAELMREAADVLRDLASSGNAQLLELTTTLCYQAAERLESAGVK